MVSGSHCAKESERRGQLRINFDGFSDVEACRAFVRFCSPILCMSTGGDGRGRTDNEVLYFL
jgi:hypothetical protein